MAILEEATASESIRCRLPGSRLAGDLQPGFQGIFRVDVQSWPGRQIVVNAGTDHIIGIFKVQLAP